MLTAPEPVLTLVHVYVDAIRRSADPRLSFIPGKLVEA